MADEEILERLRANDEHFSSLLSLIPDKFYNTDADSANQWQRKKQTKEQKKAAKRAKLDPANVRTALDIVNGDGRKRKREDGEDDEEEGDGIAKNTAINPKKAKTSTEKKADQAQAIVEKRREKRDRKKARAAADAAKRTRQLERKRQEAAAAADEEDAAVVEEAEDNSVDDQGDEEAHVKLQEPFVLNHEARDTATSSDEDEDEIAAPTVFDIPNVASGTSSTTSASLTAPTNDQPKADSPLLDSPNAKLSMEEKQAKLRAKIEALRAARKSDQMGTRQELIEARRKKEEARKKRKKEEKQKQKEEAKRLKEEEIAQSSPLLSPSIGSPVGAGRTAQNPDAGSNFSFGRVAFENGQKMSHDLSMVVDPAKKKGPSDTKSTLLAAQNKQDKLASLDEAKQAEIAEKEMWQNAKKRAFGERVKDDTSLLKKALKRQEQDKKKSKKEWDARKESVVKNQAMRQEKREENLAKRRAEKGVKGKNKKSKSTGGKKGTAQRPGFEGSFRAGSRK